MTRASPLVALALFACGGAPANSPRSATSADAERADEPSAGDSAAAKAEWDRLVKEELVWRRPDLDGSCDKARSGHYMASVTEPFEQRVVLASELGCKPVTVVLPGIGAGFPGAGYCCPKDLPPAPPPHTGGGKSCEQAQEEYVAGNQSEGASTSAGSYGAVLNRGSYFKHCGVPDSTAIDICAAVLDGRAVGVTVRTSPADKGPADCIAEAVLGLSFPKNSKMDVTRTTF